MGFGGGGGTVQPPEAEPVQPVPQEDDPRGIEEQRRFVAAQREREGYQASLLTPGGERGDERDPMTTRKTMTGNLVG